MLRFIVIICLIIFTSGCVMARPRLISTLTNPARAYQSDGIKVTIDSIVKRSMMQTYYEFQMVIENNSDQPMVFAPIDVMLVDESGNNSIPYDAWSDFSEFRLNMSSYWMAALRHRSILGGGGAYTPQIMNKAVKEEIKERYSRRFSEIIKISPQSKQEILIVFPELKKLRKLKALHILDTISGKTHKILL